MTRKDARELIMQLLYQMELLNDYEDETKNSYIEKHFAGSNHEKYAVTLLDTILNNKDSIDETINGASNKWKTTRMSKVDVSILRLAAGEVLYMDDIPDAVAINEAVSMAKKFSAEESGSFINGILGNIVKGKDA